MHQPASAEEQNRDHLISCILAAFLFSAIAESPYRSFQDDRYELCSAAGTSIQNKGKSAVTGYVLNQIIVYNIFTQSPFSV